MRRSSGLRSAEGAANGVSHQADDALLPSLREFPAGQPVAHIGARSRAIRVSCGFGVAGPFVQFGALRPRWPYEVTAPKPPAMCLARYASESRSDLIAAVAKLELELPALESRHHAAEFVPGNLATIDDDHRHSVVLVGVAVDGTA